MSGAEIANVLPQDMYGDVLIIGQTNVGLAAVTPTPIGDGVGNDSPLEISQTVVNMDRSAGKEWQLDGVAVTATAAQLNAAGSGSDATYVTLSTNAGLPNERVLTGTSAEILLTDNGAGSTVVVSIPTAVTFTGKTITGGTYAGGAFNGTLGATTPSTAAVTTLSMSGALTYGGVTLTAAVTGTGKMVLDTSPTIATPIINSAAHVGGTWVADATWTLPALTLGGTVSGGGNNLNNIIVGAVTPLAGTFTTLSGQSLATSAATPLLLTNGQLVNIALTSQTVGATTLTIPDFASVVDEFTFATKAQTMSNKTFVAPLLGIPTSGTLTNCTGFPSASLSGAVPANLGGTGVANNVASTLTISGNFATTLTVSGVTGVTLPTTGTLATLAGTEELDNKTLDSSVGKGTWTASGTWTLPAITLGGTVSGGGNQLNNIIIGTTTPLAGAFTTLSSSGQYTNTVASGTAPMVITSPTTVANLKAEAAAAIPQNSQSAAYTTVLLDAGKHILHPTADANARTFTIDSNANVAYPIGTTLTFINQINTVTIAITSNTLTLYPAGTTGSRTLAANGCATAVKVASTSWIITGVGLT